MTNGDARRSGTWQGYIWLFLFGTYCRCISNSNAGFPVWCHYLRPGRRMSELQCGFAFASFAGIFLVEPDLGVILLRKYCHQERPRLELVDGVPLLGRASVNLRFLLGLHQRLTCTILFSGQDWVSPWQASHFCTWTCTLCMV